MSSEAEWRAGPAPLLLRAIEAGVFVPSLLTKSGSCGRTSEPSAVADSNSAGSTDSSLLCRFLLRRAAPDYRTRRQSACRAGGGAQGNGLRTAYLNQQGYRVLRFCNEQANSELEGVSPSYLSSPDAFRIARRGGALIKGPLSAPKNRAPFSPYQGRRITAEIVQTPGQKKAPPRAGLNERTTLVVSRRRAPGLAPAPAPADRR
jgi:hypothetical protein